MLIKKLFIPLLILSFILLSIPGCATQQKEGSTQPQGESTPTPPLEKVPISPPENQPQVFTVSSAPSSEIKVELSIAGSPLLDQPVQVTVVFGLRENIPWDAENVTAQIILPKGFEFVSGQREWHGDVLRGKKYEISAIVKSVNTGDNLKIEARVDYQVGKSSRGGYAYLYTQVSKDRAAVSDQAFSPAEVPHVTPAEPPTESPSKPPAEPGDITPVE